MNPVTSAMKNVIRLVSKQKVILRPDDEFEATVQMRHHGGSPRPSRQAQGDGVMTAALHATIARG